MDSSVRSFHLTFYRKIYTSLCHSSYTRTFVQYPHLKSSCRTGEKIFTRRTRLVNIFLEVINPFVISPQRFLFNEIKSDLCSWESIYSSPYQLSKGWNPSIISVQISFHMDFYAEPMPYLSAWKLSNNYTGLLFSYIA